MSRYLPVYAGGGRSLSNLWWDNEIIRMYAGAPHLVVDRRTSRQPTLP
jgi:hypothetical protein